MIVPDVKCVLGEPLKVQDAWRRSFESALTHRFLDLDTAGFSSADERAEWTSKMEILSGGKNTVLWVNDGDTTTAKYFPTIMVKFPALRIRDLLINSTNENLHPAFIVNNVIKPEIYVGKYHAYQITSNSKNIGVSLYGVDPRTSLHFDVALSICSAAGIGHHMVTNAEWAMVALLAKNINAYLPKGNNSHGKDSTDPNSPEYYGVPTHIHGNKINRVGTGTGPISWSHDGTPWGVYDMTGNIYQWCSGLRLAAGEIQIIPNNDAADSNIDISRDSALWKAINATDGSLVTPEVTFASDTDTTPVYNGWGQTLKYDATNPISVVKTISTRTTSSNALNIFESVTGTNLPEITFALCLAPETPVSGAYGGGYLYVRNDINGNFSETMSQRGVHSYNIFGKGIFYMSLINYRTLSDMRVGARAAFVSM